jgi:hypothetical protein
MRACCVTQPLTIIHPLCAPPQLDLHEALAKPLVIAFSAYRSITKLVLREANASAAALLQLGTALLLNRSLARLVVDGCCLGEAGQWLRCCCAVVLFCLCLLCDWW